MIEFLASLRVEQLLEAGKFGLLYVVARLLYKLHKDLDVVLAEHRMLVNDLWVRKPEKKEEFYLAIGEQKRKLLFKKASAGRG